MVLWALGVLFGYSYDAGAASSDGSGPTETSTHAHQTEKVILRISGDEVFARTIMIPLASNYLQRIGARNIRPMAASAPWSHEVAGRMPNGDRITILIRSSTSSDGIEDIIRGDVDIAMSSRRLTAAELDALPIVGTDDQWTSRRSIDVARSGYVVVVNPQNPVDALTVEQIARIYAGEVTNWAQVGGLDQPISVLTRNKGSIARELFRGVLLGSVPEGRASEEVSSFEAMRSALRSDIAAIGYLAVPDELKVISILLSDGSSISPPDNYLLASGDYPLTQSLLLYRNPMDGNSHVSNFFREVLSARSKYLVLSAGFVEPTPALIIPTKSRTLPTEYEALTRNALRVSTTIRFADGSEDLDPSAYHSLDMLARFLRSLQVRGDRLVHIAFSHDVAETDQERAIAQRLGNIVAAELARRLVSAGEIVPLGAEMPLAEDSTPLGRGINRRVETWIRP